MDMNKDFLVLLEGALSNFNCLIPALVDLPHSSQKTYTKSLNMDQCIFVSSALVKSDHCGGLKVYRNFSVVTGNDRFCDRDFGELL